MAPVRESLSRGRSGAVTVYLAGITAAVMLFVTALIDLARITAFERLAESTVYSGVHGVLSAYDRTLYERYGLFGRGGTEGQAIFERIVRDQLSPDDAGQGWKLLQARLETSGLYADIAIGRHDVLNRQILEEMKYKAPVDFALELVDRFRPLSGAMAEAADTVRTFEELDKLHDSRQRQLEEALRSQKEAAAFIAGAGITGRIWAGQDVIRQYGSYVGWIEADAELEDDEEPAYTDDIAAYAAMARETANALRDTVRTAADGHEAKLRTARERLDAAKAINDRMADIASRSAGHAQDGGGSPRQAGAADDAAASSPGPDMPSPGDFRDIRATAKSLVLAQEWFDIYERELQAQEAGLSRILGGAGQFLSAVAGALASPESSRSAAMSDSIAAVEQTYNDYTSRYAMPGSVVSARQQALQSLNADEAQRAALEEEAKGQLDEARTFLDTISGLPRTSEASEGFDRLRELYEANRAANEASEVEADELDDAGDDGEAAADSGSYARGTMDKSEGLFGGMADMLAAFRDELYLNEYAVSRFRMFQPQRLSTGSGPHAAGGGADAQPQDGDSEQTGALDVPDQETEYIIYGFHDPVSNIAAAFGELFALRVAIRTMEGLIECRSFGHPLVVFAAAVVYGLRHALADMNRLIAGGKTPLSKWVPIEVAYRDYLRLFLLLHGSREAKLSRIAALIEWNTGYRLIDIPAGVTGEARMSIDLWFLPGVMKAAAAGGILRGKVVGGRYERTVAAGSSY